MNALPMQTVTVREFFPLRSDHDRRRLHEAFLSIWNAPQNHRFLSFSTDAFTSTEVSSWLDAHRKRFARFLCAADGEANIIGITVLIAKDHQNIEIYGLGVEPEHHGNGIGRKLLEHVVHMAQQHHIGTLSLIVCCDNRIMLSLMASLGFATVGNGASKRHDGIGTLRLQRDLKQERTPHCR